MDTLIKTVVCTASCYNRKHYFNPEMNKIPQKVKDELKIIAICLAEKLHGIFTIGFYPDGSVFLESTGDDFDCDYDEIGSVLEIEKLKKEEKELFDSLQLWYKNIYQKQIKNKEH